MGGGTVGLFSRESEPDIRRTGGWCGGYTYAAIDEYYSIDCMVMMPYDDD